MPIELKGSIFTLLVIYLHNAKPDIIRRALEEKIAQSPNFLKHASVVVNISNISTPVSWQNLQQAITATGLRIVGVSGCNDVKIKEEIYKAKLPILIEGKNQPNYFILKAAEISKLNEKTIKPITTKTRFIDIPVIRSGQCIYASNCDLIVASHVSAGAELIADGNIHIYGIMCGRALAGANGDKNAQIFCTQLKAELVSIAGVYWLGENIPAEFYSQAIRLSLKNNNLTIQFLN